VAPTNGDGPSQLPHSTGTQGAAKKRRFPGAKMVAEKWFAWRASHEMLDSYNRARVEQPPVSGKALYERVVVQRSGLDAKAASGILLRAEESFCDWPAGRELRFRDVVLYVIIDEYLRSHVGDLGTQTNMGKIVGRVIPKDL